MKYSCVVFCLALILFSSGVGAQSKPQGFSFMSDISGIWYGEVYSSSSAGSFDSWHLDFRPIAPGEIAQYSMLDSSTVNNMSFFVCTYNGESRIAMRTEGCFRNQCCVTYELLDSVNKETGYYRFSDVVKGVDRAYTEFVFTDSTLMMQVYTTKFGGISVPALHTRLNAVRGDVNSAQYAVEYFQDSKTPPRMDLTSAFDGMEESIFYSYENDVYKAPEGFLSAITVDIEIDPAFELGEDAEIFVLLCTKSMYDGLKLKDNYKDYYSRYVFLPVETEKYTLKNVHPGEYFLYSFVDLNGDKKHLSGDLMSSKPENVFMLEPNSNQKVHTLIDMKIP
ncbi:MAG: hypothetical protein JXR53_00105 [Bacteroidales bacterium]|nr:hypothetical protein [Bacteroidales bacterium]